MTDEQSSVPPKAPAYGLLSDQIPQGLGEYWRENFGHALQFGDENRVRKLVPAGTPRDAPMAETIAIEAAKRFGGVDRLEQFQEGHLWEVPAFRDIPPVIGPRKGHLYQLPGFARTAQAVELLCWPASAANFYNEWHRLTNWFGLHEIDLRDDLQINSPFVQKPKILDSSPFLKPDNDGTYPNGWYPGAKGTTIYWRKYYMLDRYCKRLFRELRFDQVCLAVSAVTYHFEETDDYEHRLNFAVWANHVNELGDFTNEWEKIKKHREAAERVAVEMNKYMTLFPASPESIAARKRIWEANL